MARPNKQGLSYFPFDVDFFSDEKVGAISGEFGIKGEITTVKLLCAIYRNGYFTLWDEALKMSLLKDLPGISLELLERIVFRLVKWGFFEQDLFSSVKVLTSKAIQERYFEAIKRRKRKDDYPYLLVNVDINPINVNNNPINVCNNTQRKEKEIKETSLSRGKENAPPDNMFPPDELGRLMAQPSEWLRFQPENIFRQTRKVVSDADVISLIGDYVCKLKAEGVGYKSLEDAKSHFANWSIKIIKSNENGNNRANYTSKQEANEYALGLLFQHGRELDEGMACEVERPF